MEYCEPKKAGQISWANAVSWITRYQAQRQTDDPLYYVIPYASIALMCEKIEDSTISIDVNPENRTVVYESGTWDSSADLAPLKLDLLSNSLYQGFVNASSPNRLSSNVSNSKTANFNEDELTGIQQIERPVKQRRFFETILSSISSLIEKLRCNQPIPFQPFPDNTPPPTQILVKPVDLTKLSTIDADPLLSQLATLQNQGIVSSVQVGMMANYPTLFFNYAWSDFTYTYSISHLKIYFGLNDENEVKLIPIPALAIYGLEEEGDTCFKIQYYQNLVIPDLNPIDYGSLCPPSCGFGGIAKETEEFERTKAYLESLGVI